MQRQKSILSFFQKPLPPDGCNSSAGEQLLNSSSSSEIRGTDTPPEKVPRQRLPFRRDDVSSYSDTSSQPSLFSSIMHKFVKVADNKHASSAGNHIIGGSSNIFGATGNINKPGGVAHQVIASNGFPKSNGKIDKEGRLHIELDNDDTILGPETPGSRPLVPRLRRIQEDQYGSDDKNQPSLKNSAKRVKFLESFIGKENNDNLFNEAAASKFSWLDPSRIRDASGRRPDDALYDKNTLYIPPEALKSMSASQKQYWEAKSQYMDVLLFFKVGKFYELYELDAEIGHKELDWKMTFSGVGKCRQVGISESGIDDAVQKLLARGYKVGRIEQLETSDQAKSRGANSVIQRKLVHVFTPSTMVDGNIGPDVVHLLAIEESCTDLENGSKVYGFAFVDCAALKFWVGSISDDESCAALGALLMHVLPKEVIYGNPGLSKEAQKALRNYSLNGPNTVQLTPVLPSNDFVNATEIKSLIQRKGYFKGSSNSWDSSLNGIIHHDIAVSALGGLIGHLSRLLLEDTLCKGDISPYYVYGGSLKMDGQTLVNLEIFNNNADGGYSGTLYRYLDNCITSSGKRLLRNWICHPLREIEGINNRLNVVEDLMSHSEVMSLVAQHLRKLPDLERLLGRIKASTHPSVSLVLPLLGKKIIKKRVKVFGSLVKGLRTGIDMLMLLQMGGHLNSPFFKLLNLPVLGGTNGLNQFLSQFDAAIDSDFPKYQDHNVMDADAETLSLLTELFIERATSWTQVIHAINCTDVLRSFAFTASFAPGVMSRPVLLPHSMSPGIAKGNDQPTLEIQGLWHPFAFGESGGLPVPNDLLLGQNRDGFHPCTLLLTGPNMGGKSTLLRATCLAVILSQLGSYVPCEKCVLSLVDTIFTRLGASDRIMTGESTFFIECAETATILQSATQDSLVLLDELGRGTSTFDGYAIAYAVFRHLMKKVNCRLLFATHYHSLTKEFGSHPHVTLQHMACSFKPKEHRNLHGREDLELVFLYRLSPGACPESYGLQVALMAGIPQQVVAAASDAGLAMKKSIAESYRSSEQRLEFSTLHEAWLKTIVALSRIGTHPRGEDDFITLLCLWHEVRSSYQQRK